MPQGNTQILEKMVQMDRVAVGCRIRHVGDPTAWVDHEPFFVLIARVKNLR